MATIRKRETKSGVSFLARVRLKGCPPQTATFKRLTDAKKWIQDTESGMDVTSRQSSRKSIALRISQIAI